jgi:hypothetical protein
MLDQTDSIVSHKNNRPIEDCNATNVTCQRHYGGVTCKRTVVLQGTTSGLQLNNDDDAKLTIASITGSQGLPVEMPASRYRCRYTVEIKMLGVTGRRCDPSLAVVYIRRGSNYEMT